MKFFVPFVSRAQAVIRGRRFEQCVYKHALLFLREPPDRLFVDCTSRCFLQRRGNEVTDGSALENRSAFDHLLLIAGDSCFEPFRFLPRGSQSGHFGYLYPDCTAFGRTKQKGPRCPGPTPRTAKPQPPNYCKNAPTSSKAAKHSRSHVRQYRRSVNPKFVPCDSANAENGRLDRSTD